MGISWLRAVVHILPHIVTVFTPWGRIICIIPPCPIVFILGLPSFFYPTHSTVNRFFLIKPISKCKQCTTVLCIMSVNPTKVAMYCRRSATILLQQKKMVGIIYEVPEYLSHKFPCMPSPAWHPSMGWTLLRRISGSWGNHAAGRCWPK